MVKMKMNCEINIHFEYKNLIEKLVYDIPYKSSLFSSLEN